MYFLKTYTDIKIIKSNNSKITKISDHSINDFLFIGQLNELITGALKGFRSVIRNGDKILNIDSMEPYEIEDDLMWFYDDRIGQTKYVLPSIVFQKTEFIG